MLLMYCRQTTWWTGISRCLIGGRYTVEGFEDTKRVIRIRKSKNRQHNGQRKKTEEQTTQWPKEKDRTNNDLQNTTHKTKALVTRTPLKTGSELRCSIRVSSSCSTSGTRLG